MTNRSAFPAKAVSAATPQRSRAIVYAAHWGACLFAIVLATAGSSFGAEPYQAFLGGLRDRGYYDIALDYLDQIEQSAATPAAVRVTIPYERAQTYQLSASSRISLEERRLQLDRAEQELSRFVSESPDHPLAGRANYDRARILLGRAQVDIWDAEASEQASLQADRRNRARNYLTQAGAIVAQAIDLNRREVQTFPTFIPESEKARRASRDEALNRLMESQLAAAEISYWQAQSHPADTRERRTALELAMKEFERIVQQYRDASAGTYAELWQGKCYEELGEISKALPIFEHVLAISESDSENQGTVRVLKDLALRFRLICLNHDQRKDYGIVVEEADAWLKNHRERASTDIGLGIQWELARALETLGADRSRSDAQRRGDQNAALERAREISRFGGEYKANATRLVQRMMLALDRKGGEARDFASAYAAATAIMDQSRQLSETYRAALATGDASASAEAQRAIKGAGDQMARLFTQAIQLKGRNTEPEKVVSARLQLGYAYFLQAKYLDCAALAEHEFRQQTTAFPDLAREAGFLAMSALEAEIASSTGDHDLEADWLTRIGERLIATWPTSDRAQEARMLLGRAAWSQDEFLTAARWWNEIPVGAAQHAAAQISAGQAYWRQYVRALQTPEDRRPDAEQLREWKQAAVDRLENGIEQRQRSLMGDATTPDELVLGKITLAQLRNLDGQFRAAGTSRGSIEILSEGPHDVMTAVKAPLSGERPKDPGRAQSAQMASLAYQQLLRGYIGVQDLEAAGRVRAELEELSGAANPEALTAIYVEFGRELQRELDRLTAAGESDRAAETRRGFEEFLTSLTRRTDGQSFSSMLWIAETLAGLGEGTADDDPTTAADGFRKSARIYEQMLARVDEPGFLPDPSYRQLLQLHLARNLRREGDFPAAERILQPLLTANNSAPDVQAEAAHLYGAWGASGEGAEAEARLRTALSGRRGGGGDVWGWNLTVNRLQREAATRPTDPLLKMLADARYNLAATEFALAKRTSDRTDRERRLSQARQAIFSYIRATRQIEDSDHAKFNALYGQVLAELGDPIKPLPRDPRELAAERPSSRPVAAAVGQPTPPARKAKPAAQTSMLLVWSLVGAGLLAAGGILYSMMRQVGRKRQRILELGRAAAAPRKSMSSVD